MHTQKYRYLNSSQMKRSGNNLPLFSIHHNNVAFAAELNLWIMLEHPDSESGSGSDSY